MTQISPIAHEFPVNFAAMWLWAVLACAGSDCVGLTGEARSTCLTEACAREGSLAADACRAKVLGALEKPAEVGAVAAQMNDPLVRDAALLLWIDGHRPVISPAEGRALCDRVSRNEGEACRRKLSAAHLSR